MADVRALLRQQRAARRINHPYATYSDAGKLLCTLCRDQIRAEAHWDAHLLSDKHKKRLSAISASANANDDDRVEEEDAEKHENEREEEDAEDHDALAQKRKLDQVAAEDKDTDIDDEDEARRKRSRPEAASDKSGPEEDRANPKKPLVPAQGVQVQMPSRSSTPSQPAVPKLTTSLPSRQASNLATPASSSSMSINIQPQSSTASLSQQQSQQPPQPTSQDQQVDEDEWAAFEAEIAATSAAQEYDDDAVISRPAMTAEEAAAAKEAEEQATQDPESRKSKADADLEDEREEATRALEDEFEEMQELEARVQRLKEKREALMRKRGESLSQGQAAAEADDLRTTTKLPSDPQDKGKENVQATGNSIKAETDDDDDEDDEEDDWDGFRFRTGR
ncbi:hypothetical protein TrVFT333_010796 [Trichoderma virens FT-333]|nr:hypothetical protein TrVFT333_010796 [Trichoderma virens FT-333]